MTTKIFVSHEMKTFTVEASYSVHLLICYALAQKSLTYNIQQLTSLTVTANQVAKITRSTTVSGTVLYSSTIELCTSTYSSPMNILAPLPPATINIKYEVHKNETSTKCKPNGNCVTYGT